MDRIPCKICSAQILPATFQLNNGLCGRCMKGHRPCKYCGKHVSEPNADGTFSHMECEQKHRQSQLYLGWKTPKKVDWSVVTDAFFSHLSECFRAASLSLHKAPSYHFDIDCYCDEPFHVEPYRVAPDRSIKPERYSLQESQFNQNYLKVCATFDHLYEKFEDKEEQLEEFNAHILEAVENACDRLRELNFHFTNDTKVISRVVVE